MKIAIIADTHWGVRNDHPAFILNNTRFLENVFFPYIDANRIGGVIHAGDLVDRRKYININTARALREDFLDPIADRDLLFFGIAGNHDTYYKNTNGINSLFELVRGDRCNVYINPTEWDVGGLPILFLPWICDDNREFADERIRHSTCPIVIGHLELKGHEQYKGQVAVEGDDPSRLGRFDAVYSGHFHHRSSRGNIHYLGSHGQFTWSDYDDVRGFHVLDTETRQVEFIENPYTMFEKIWYDDRDKTIEEILSADFSVFDSKMVKVIVTAKTNPYFFDKFIEKAEEHDVIDMQIVEDHRNLDLQDNEEIINEAESTLDIFRGYIESAAMPGANKLKVEKIIEELYTEALSIQ